MSQYIDSVVADLVIVSIKPGHPVSISRSGAYDFTREAEGWESTRGNVYLDLDAWDGRGVEGECYRAHRYLLPEEDKPDLERALALQDWEGLEALAERAIHAYGRVSRLRWTAAA